MEKIKLPQETSKEIDIERAKKHIKRLRHLLEDFSNEIPDQIISGAGNYKVRGLWFSGFIGTIDKAVSECKVTDEEFSRDLDNFHNKYQQRRKEHRENPQALYVRTTKEEIDTADSLLKRLIEKLQNKLAYLNK